jgi:hypothetical protein
MMFAGVWVEGLRGCVVPRLSWWVWGGVHKRRWSLTLSAVVWSTVGGLVVGDW